MAYERVVALAAGPGWRIRTWRLAQLAVTFVVILAALALGWGAGAAFLLGLLSASVLSLIDSRVSVAAGLICLASCPLLLVAERYAWLEQSALVNYYAASIGIYNLRIVADTMLTWALYFLCIGLAARTIGYLARRQRDDGAPHGEG